MRKSKNLGNSLHSSKNSSKILLSICVPVKNDLAVAREFVKQMAEQTEEPDEVIFVDGHSTDGTYEYLVEASKKYKWLRVERQETEFITPAAARNQAVRHCRGEFVYILDADIKLENDFIRKMKKELSKSKPHIFFFNVKSYPSIEYKSIWHKLFYWKDNAVGILKGGPLVIYRKDAFIFQQDKYFYGEDRVCHNQLMEMVKERIVEHSKKTYWVSSKSVESFKEAFNRYFKYGFTSPEFVFGLSKPIEKLKAIGGWLSIPFFPILIVGFAKGLYQTIVWRSFGWEVIFYPLIEPMIMVIFSLGFWSRVAHEFLRFFGLRKAWNKS
ncbi:MAG: glycosyltransferase family 2 protein [Candidatus Anstonellales archaeon]